MAGPDREKALTEMKRVTRAGGRVGFYLWDYPGGGVEFNVTENIAVRGEVLAIVEEGDLWSARATPGVLFRF